jgi:putative DNA primase/helicase
MPHKGRSWRYRMAPTVSARQAAGADCAGVPTPKWLRHRGPETPVIVPAPPAHLRELAALAATWAKFDKRAKRWEEALPPAWVIDALLARPAWSFPALEAIVSTPTMRPDGSVLVTPGYDPHTGLYLEVNPADYPPLPAHPTHEDACQALKTLAAVFINFPFAHLWHQSSACAAILSLLVRYAIEGNGPLFAVSSTTRGSGKGLLIDVVSLIGTGRTAPRMAQTQDENEERKRLMTLALAGTTVVHIDNLTTPSRWAPAG